MYFNHFNLDEQDLMVNCADKGCLACQKLLITSQIFHKYLIKVVQKTFPLYGQLYATIFLDFRVYWIEKLNYFQSKGYCICRNENDTCKSVFLAYSGKSFKHYFQKYLKTEKQKKHFLSLDEYIKKSELKSDINNQLDFYSLNKNGLSEYIYRVIQDCEKWYPGRYHPCIKEAYLLRLVENRKLKEIGTILGFNPSTIHRWICSLKNILKIQIQNF